MLDQLNQSSLPAIRRFFTSLQPPDPDSLRGIFRGIFVGSRWLKSIWVPLLAITGLGGWWGKQFDLNGNALNLVLRQGQFEFRFPMYIILQPSYLDHRPGLALRYRKENPFPWPLIVDELRRIDPKVLLGMTLADFGPLRKLAFPFILQSQEAADGG